MPLDIEDISLKPFIMLVVANLANTKWYKNPKKLAKPWEMGTHMRVLLEIYPMNTTMTGFRRFSKIFAFLYFGGKFLQHWKG